MLLTIIKFLQLPVVFQCARQFHFALSTLFGWVASERIPSKVVEYGFKDVRRYMHMFSFLSVKFSRIKKTLRSG